MRSQILFCRISFHFNFGISSITRVQNVTWTGLNVKMETPLCCTRTHRPRRPGASRGPHTRIDNNLASKGTEQTKSQNERGCYPGRCGYNEPVRHLTLSSLLTPQWKKSPVKREIDNASAGGGFRESFRKGWDNHSSGFEPVLTKCLST